MMNADYVTECSQLQKTYRALSWGRRFLFRIFSWSLASALDRDDMTMPQAGINIYRAYKNSFFSRLLRGMMSPLVKFETSKIFRIGELFNKNEQEFQRVLGLQDPNVLLEIVEPLRISDLSLQQPLCSALSTLNPQQLTNLKSIMTKHSLRDVKKLITILQSSEQFELIQVIDQRFNQVYLVSNMSNSTCSQLLEIINKQEKINSELLGKLTKNTNLLRLLSVLMKKDNSVWDENKIRQLISLIPDHNAKMTLLISLFENEQPALKNPWGVIKNTLNYEIYGAISSIHIDGLITLFNLDNWTDSAYTYEIISDTDLRHALTQREKQSIYEKMIHMSVSQNQKLTLIQIIAKLDHTEGIEPLLSNANGLSVLKFFLKHKKTMSANTQCQLVERIQKLSHDDFTSLEKMMMLPDISGNELLSILNSPQQTKITRILCENAFMVNRTKLMAKISNIDAFVEQLERLEKLNMVSSDYIDALADDLSFVDKMEAARVARLPTHYTTKLIDPNCSQVDPVFRRNGTEINISPSVGQATFKLAKDSLYIERMYNLSQKTDQGISTWQHVGRALHEYLFRESCVLPRLSGRVTLQAAWGSECFHYQCGFRVMPKEDVHNTLLHNQKDDHEGKELLQQLYVFWKELAAEKPLSSISHALNDVFQCILKNVNIIAAWEQKSPHRIRLLAALKEQNIKQILQILAPPQNQKIADELPSTKERKKQRGEGSYNMFLPYSSIVANGKRYGIRGDIFQADESSRLYTAIHETDYQQYLTPELESIIVSIADKIKDSAQPLPSFAEQQGLFAGEASALPFDPSDLKPQQPE